MLFVSILPSCQYGSLLEFSSQTLCTFGSDWHMHSLVVSPEVTKQQVSRARSFCQAPLQPYPLNFLVLWDFPFGPLARKLAFLISFCCVLSQLCSHLGPSDGKTGRNKSGVLPTMVFWHGEFHGLYRRTQLNDFFFLFPPLSGDHCFSDLHFMFSRSCGPTVSATDAFFREFPGGLGHERIQKREAERQKKKENNRKRGYLPSYFGVRRLVFHSLNPN